MCTYFIAPLHVDGLGALSNFGTRTGVFLVSNTYAILGTACSGLISPQPTSPLLNTRQITLLGAIRQAAAHFISVQHERRLRDRPQKQSESRTAPHARPHEPRCGTVQHAVQARALSTHVSISTMIPHPRHTLPSLSHTHSPSLSHTHSPSYGPPWQGEHESPDRLTLRGPSPFSPRQCPAQLPRRC